MHKEITGSSIWIDAGGAYFMFLQSDLYIFLTITFQKNDINTAEYNFLVHPSIHPSVLWCFSECGATVYVEKPRSPSNQPAIQVFWSDGTVFWASFTGDTKSLWDDQAPHPISSRKPRQPEKEIISLLISVIPFLWSLTTVHSHRWGWEGRCSNSRASLSYSALSSPQ